MTKDESPNQACNELIKFLVPLAEGAIVPDLVNEIHDVVKAVRDTGRAGDISLKIKIAPCNGSERQVVVNAEINSKPPKSARPMSLYFTDEDGALHRQDPLQMGLKFDEAKPEISK